MLRVFLVYCSFPHEMPRTGYRRSRYKSRLRYRRKWLSRSRATRASRGRYSRKALIRKRLGKLNTASQRLEFQGTLATLNATNFFGFSNVNLAQCQDSSLYTQLYDFYRIRKVRFWVTSCLPEQHTSIYTIPAAAESTKLYQVTWNAFFDPEDLTSVPGALNFLSMGPGRVKRKIVWDGSTSKPARFTFVPSVQMYTSPWSKYQYSPWIPTAVPTVPHGCVKWQFRTDEANFTGVDPTINIDVQYRMELYVDFKYRQ